MPRASTDYLPNLDLDFSINRLPNPVKAVASIPAAIVNPLLSLGKNVYKSHIAVRSPGELAREQGQLPYLPVLIIPGFMSSGLLIMEGKEGWKGSRGWLSLQKLGWGGRSGE